MFLQFFPFGLLCVFCLKLLRNKNTDLAHHWQIRATYVYFVQFLSNSTAYEYFIPWLRFKRFHLIYIVHNELLRANCFVFFLCLGTKHISSHMFYLSSKWPFRAQKLHVNSSYKKWFNTVFWFHVFWSTFLHNSMHKCAAHCTNWNKAKWNEMKQKPNKNETLTRTSGLRIRRKIDNIVA